jgi:hypothetical protein
VRVCAGISAFSPPPASEASRRLFSRPHQQSSVRCYHVNKTVAADNRVTTATAGFCSFPVFGKVDVKMCQGGSTRSTNDI